MVLYLGCCMASVNKGTHSFSILLRIVTDLPCAEETHHALSQPGIFHMPNSLSKAFFSGINGSLMYIFLSGVAPSSEHWNLGPPSVHSVWKQSCILNLETYAALCILWFVVSCPSLTQNLTGNYTPNVARFCLLESSAPFWSLVQFLARIRAYSIIDNKINYLVWNWSLSL